MNFKSCIVWAGLCVCLQATAQESLEQQFLHPPDSARPWVYWTCQDGHYSLEGTTADLEAMKQAGIGGVLRMDCHVGIPTGPTPYLSPAWRRQFIHAVRECQRLGLAFATITGPGWTGTGGPWIRPEQSMRHLVPGTITVTGPTRFDQVLPLPPPRISPYHRHQTPQMKQAIDAYWQDVAVFALPHCQPVIDDIQEKALFIRNPFTSMPGVRPRLPSPASYGPADPKQVIDPAAIVDLTDRLQPDGRLTWDVPAGRWTIVRLTVRSTGANTRPAPDAGMGLESDKFSRQALQRHFEKFFDPLLQAIGPRPAETMSGFFALDADSWEMSSQNWTDDFRRQFILRCGYDPRPWFVTYTGCVVGSRRQTERFLWDVRKVCQQLLLENHAAELKRLCAQRGLRLMIEPYDMNPAGDLDLGAYADFPAGEFWYDGFLSAWSCIEAASIAHVTGKPIVMAEAFTSFRGNWQRTPWVLKNQADWALAIGINRLAIHGFAHQVNEKSPGMTFGRIGIFWNRKQTFWPLVADFHQYLARCSHLLQQGRTVADILYLTPEGVPQVFLPPSSALHGAGTRMPDMKGYRFDGCSPRLLIERAEVRNGLLTFPGGTSYRLLVLPRWKTMTPPLLEKIAELVRAGATVIGIPPQASPSLRHYPECDRQVKALAEQLWGKPPYRQERTVGRGRVILDRAGLSQGEDLAQAGSFAAAARWIWLDAGNPAVSAPAGVVHFRYLLDLPDRPGLEKAVIQATADNAFTLQVNGRPVLSGDRFDRLYRSSITSCLKTGRNVITVSATNQGPQPNPAGFIAAIDLDYADGTRRTLGTDTTWSASTDKTHWSACRVLGPAGMEPWRLQPDKSSTPVVEDLYPDYDFTAALLARQGVPEDLVSDVRLRYAHRRTATRDIYFLSNPTNRHVRANCRFRVQNGRPQLWDAVTGTLRPLPHYTHHDQTTEVPLELAAYQSLFVVFPRLAHLGRSASRTGVNFPPLRTLATLSGPWEVSFDPRWGGPEKVVFPTLEDWTDRPETGIKHYSGIATYRTTFDLPPGAQGELYLDLGTVHELAEVSVNGKRLGTVWCAPWRIRLPGRLEPRDNRLEIRVANLWTNRLLADATLPAGKRLTWTAIPFRITGPLKPSGLLGPVTLLAEVPAKAAP